MSEHGDAARTFVVGVDRDAVLRRREIVAKVQRRGAWVTLVIGAVGIVAALYAVFAFRGAGMWPFAVLLIAAMIPLVLSTVLALRLQAERQRWIKAVEPVYKIWIGEMDKRGLPGQKMFDDLLATTAKYGRK